VFYILYFYGRLSAAETELVVVKNMVFTVSITYMKNTINIITQGRRTKNHESSV
jgi:hypothetical protein